jgi:putative spermidine/putrescine transport system permease protein
MAEATIEGATETRAGPMLAADGTPLRASLARSLRRQKWRAFLLVLPLLAFVVVFFAAPIVDMLFRSVENGIVRDTLPRTIAALSADPDPVPGEEVFAALHLDLVVAEERKRHTQLGTRLNYEIGGASSLFRGTGRAIGDFGEDLARDLAAIDPRLTETAAWVGWFGDDATRAALPRTRRRLGRLAVAAAAAGRGRHPARPGGRA